jgi:hypothetical protein
MLSGRLPVQYADRRLLVIASRGDKLIQYLAFVLARCRLVTATDGVGEFGRAARVILESLSTTFVTVST